MGRHHHTDLQKQALDEVLEAWHHFRWGAEIDALRRYIYLEGPEGLDPSLAHALALIVRADGARVRDVASALRIDASNATRAVTKLEEAGLVVRDRDGADKRGVAISPTRAGIERHRTLEARGRQVMSEVLDAFEPHESLALANYLQRLISRSGQVLAEHTAD